MFAQRIEKVKTSLSQNNLDAILITNPANLLYLSGFVCLSPTEREAYILITKKSAYVLTSPLYAGEIKTPDLQLIVLSAQVPLSKAIKNILEKENLTTLGFEEDNLRYSEYERLAKIDTALVPSHLETLRSQKDSQEISAIEQACDIGDTTFTYILPHIKPGISEKELALEMELFIRKQHATLSFPSIIAFGENAAVPHHVTSDRKLSKNEFVLLDFGVKVNGYCSDMSRTVFVGKPSDEEKKMYQAVYDAQQRAIDYVQTHTTSALEKEADKIARDYITSQGFPSFPHSLGHGIGIEVHESPSLSPYSQETLRSGMVFSIEPGIYLEKKSGVRIEDLMVLEQNKARLLTKSSRELIVL